MESILTGTSLSFPCAFFLTSIYFFFSSFVSSQRVEVGNLLCRKSNPIFYTYRNRKTCYKWITLQSNLDKCMATPDTRDYQRNKYIFHLGIEPFDPFNELSLNIVYVHANPFFFFFSFFLLYREFDTQHPSTIYLMLILCKRLETISPFLIFFFTNRLHVYKAQEKILAPVTSRIDVPLYP